MNTTAENVEDFADDVDDFDLDAWIDQGSRPCREVAVYRDRALVEEYDRLAEKLDQEPGADDESMSETSVCEQLEDIRERMEACRLFFIVDALTREEKTALAKKAPAKPLLDGEGKQIVSAAGVPRVQVDSFALGDTTAVAAVIKVSDAATGKKRSTISQKQIRNPRVILGDGPTYGLYKEVGELSQAGQALPSVPTSREH